MGGGRLLRADVLHRLPDADRPARVQRGDRVLVWGAAGGLGVFAVQLCRLSGADCVGSSRRPRRASCAARWAPDYIDRNEFAGMMRRGDETERRRPRARRSRAASASKCRELLGAPPDIVFEHVGAETFPTSVLTVKPFGKVVICGPTSGYQLDFDVRYLWMRQKQIVGSHFANAYEATRANELIESGKIQPVLWKTMAFDSVAEAHQSMYKNEHLGKTRSSSGPRPRASGARPRAPGRSARRWVPDGRSCADPLVRHAVPGRPVRGGAPGDRVDRAPRRRHGVRGLPVPRRRLQGPPVATFEHHADFERYWYSEEFSTWRADYSGFYQVPVLYVWHDLIMRGGIGEL